MSAKCDFSSASSPRQPWCWLTWRSFEICRAGGLHHVDTASPAQGHRGGILTCPWPSVLTAAEGAAFKRPLDCPTPQSNQRSLRRWERMQTKEASRGSPGVSLPRTELGVPSHTAWWGQPHHSPPWACSSLHFPSVCKIWPGDYLRKRRRGWVGHEFWGKPLRVNESLAALFM